MRTAKRVFTVVGYLPKGDWRFGLIAIEGKPDVVIVVDRSGCNAPRMVIDGKLVELKC